MEILRLIAGLVIFSLYTRGWKSFYIVPDDSKCPVDRCYTLTNVVDDHDAKFVDSNTTLKLLPGRYDIRNRIGQLMISYVKHFSVKQSASNNSVKIFCHPNATFGITIMNSFNITISDLEIVHCGTPLDHYSLNQIQNVLEQPIFEDYYPDYDDDPQFQLLMQWLHNPSSCKSADIPCRATIFFINNEIITLKNIKILYSEHIGVFTIKNPGLGITECDITYNDINCVIYVFMPNEEDVIISHSHITFGQTKSSLLGSGLNLFIHADGWTSRRSCYIYVTSTVLANNTAGSHGNFYLDAFSYDKKVYVFIINVSIIADHNLANDGLVIQHSQSIDNIISVEDSILEACCVKIMGESEQEIRILRTQVNKSPCSAAVTKIDNNYLHLTNTTIFNGLYNIIYVYKGGIRLTGKNVFYGNKGTLIVENAKLVFENKTFTIFRNNIASSHDSIFYIDTCQVHFLGTVVFKSNIGREGGGILAYKSTMFFSNSSVTFIGNIADNGGAINLKEGSYIRISDTTNISLLENKARYYGGGIFVDEIGLWIRKTQSIRCYIYLEKDLKHKNIIHFENNTADLAGMSLFGGWIDVCTRMNNFDISNVFDFKVNHNNSFSEISSNPTRVCMCVGSVPQKYLSSKNVTLYPGQTFQLKAVAVGQRFGVIPAVVRAQVENKQYNVIDDLQKWQDVGKECTLLQYTLHSSNQYETILLTINNQLIPSPSTGSNQNLLLELLQFRINFVLQKCYIGFVFDSNYNTCVCHHLLKQQGIHCNITSHTVIRKAPKWMSSTPHSQDIMLNHQCPLHYCKTLDVSLNLSNSDDQCAFNHSGILCGACQSGLSQVLGTSNCRKCSNV